MNQYTKAYMYASWWCETMEKHIQTIFMAFEIWAEVVSEQI